MAAIRRPRRSANAATFERRFGSALHGPDWLSGNDQHAALHSVAEEGTVVIGEEIVLVGA